VAKSLYAENCATRQSFLQVVQKTGGPPRLLTSPAP